MRYLAIFVLALILNSCTISYYANDTCQLRIFRNKYILSDESIENVSVVKSEGKIFKYNGNLICVDSIPYYSFVIVMSDKKDTLTVVSYSEPVDRPGFIVNDGERLLLRDKKYIFASYSDKVFNSY